MPILGRQYYTEHTVLTQIERRRSNFRLGFFYAVAFKFEPNLTLKSSICAPKSGLLSSAALIKSAVVFAVIQYTTRIILM